MKRSVLLAVMLAAFLIVAPAVAQEADSVAAEVSGNSVNQCAALLQATRTGNAEDTRSTLQYDGEADDIEVEGGSTTLSPALEAACEQTIERAATAAADGVNSSAPAPPETETDDIEAPDPGDAGMPSGRAPSPGAPSGETRELPKTGGSTSPLGLAAVVLLVGGGLLLRGVTRRR